MRVTAIAPALLLLCLSAACAPEGDGVGDDTGEAGADGKADAWNSPLAAAARAYAEAFPFSADTPHPTLVPRDAAWDTGPTWVRRAYAAHRAWEDNDLGSARLYRWTVTGKRVWAIRTSTDGDDSFIELFDASGDWLATGVGGYVPDPTTPGDYVEGITWDASPGDVRNELAPWDIVPELQLLRAALEEVSASDSESGVTVTLGESERVVEVLLEGHARTGSLDGWDRAGLLRWLADPTARITAPARSQAEATVRFYRAGESPSGAVSTPSVTHALWLSAALAPRFALARAEAPNSAAGTGSEHLMVVLAHALGVFPSSPARASLAALRTNLAAAGADARDQDDVVHNLGAADPGARLFRATPFHYGNDFWPVLDPGSLWLVVSPARTDAAVLWVRAAAEAPDAVRAAAEAGVERLTGARVPLALEQVRQRDEGTFVDAKVAFEGGASLGVVLFLPRRGTQAPEIYVRRAPEALDDARRAGLEAALAGSLGVSAPRVLAAAAGPGPDEELVLYEAGAAIPKPVRLARVHGLTASAEAATPAGLPDGTLRALALGGARAHALSMVTGLGDEPKLEVLLKTWSRTEADLASFTAANAEESAVGYSAATDAAQFMLPSVWGDNAVFVTFGKDGSVRLEDFN